MKLVSIRNINFKRTIFITVIVIFLISVFSFFKKPQKPLNILLISIDTLRPDHMGVYGYPKNTTPNIDAWAKNATVFTNVTTVIPMTFPSFSALMTGREPVKTRIMSNLIGFPLSPNTKNLAQILKNNGYSTAAFSPWGKDASKNGLFNGFDKAQYWMYKYPYYDSNGNERFGQTDWSGYENLIIKATEWLRNQKGKKFFEWIHLMDPHAPYFPPPNLACKFNTKYCGDITGKTLDELDVKRAEYQECQSSSVPTDRIEEMETLYDGGIAYSDILVGKILKSLKESGLDKNTVVILYGDHGEGFDHNYYFNHWRVLYDSAIKIPLVIYYPSATAANQKSDILIQNTDILPTLLDLLHIPWNGPSFDGKSFASLFKGNNFPFLNPKPRQFAISMNALFDKFSIYNNGFKYIYSQKDKGACLLKGQEEELYDLKKDPKETKNLLKDKPQVAKKLKSKLLDYLSPYNLPVVNPFIESKLRINDEVKDQSLQKNSNNDPLQNIKSLGY